MSKEEIEKEPEPKIKSVFKATFKGESLTIIKLIDWAESLDEALEIAKTFSAKYGTLICLDESYKAQPRPQFKPKFKPKDNRPQQGSQQRPREDYKPRPKWLDIREDAPGRWRR